jgi:hypothetical protein
MRTPRGGDKGPGQGLDLHEVLTSWAGGCGGGTAESTVRCFRLKLPPDSFLALASFLPFIHSLDAPEQVGLGHISPDLLHGSFSFWSEKTRRARSTLRREVPTIRAVSSAVLPVAPFGAAGKNLPDSLFWYSSLSFRLSTISINRSRSFSSIFRRFR